MSKINTSRSRENVRSHRNKKSKINIVDRSHNRSGKDRAMRKKIQREKKFRRRRIFISLLLIIIVVVVFNFVSQVLNSYGVMGYPIFRDQVLESLEREVFISSSEGRSLTTAEKVADFDNLYEEIERNYAVDNGNLTDFTNFVNSYADFRKKILSSKTDQEYFTLIDQYLEVLDDNRTFILDKEAYDDLFEYYRNEKNSYRSDILQNPQAVDRYKRLIEGSKIQREPMSLSVEKGYILRINLPDFKSDQFDKDYEKILSTVTNNPGITTILLDLSDNNSIDDNYRNKFAKMLINSDFSESHLIFYRGNLLDKTLESFKDNENDEYTTSFVKNDASKYNNEVLDINIDDYMYYDELKTNLKSDNIFAKRNIYILTNANTSNEAIKLCSILKQSGAYIVKNALEAAPTYKDVIYNMRSDLYLLEHSGLILSINGSYSKNEEDRFLEYDQRINSKDPINTMLSIIG